jgi:hypothetical protein
LSAVVLAGEFWSAHVKPSVVRVIWDPPTAVQVVVVGHEIETVANEGLETDHDAPPFAVAMMPELPPE